MIHINSLYIPIADKSAVKKVPDFKNIHGRHFMKADSLDEEVERHSQRALLLLSGKNPASAKSMDTIFCLNLLFHTKIFDN